MFISDHEYFLNFLYTSYFYILKALNCLFKLGGGACLPPPDPPPQKKNAAWLLLGFLAYTVDKIHIDTSYRNPDLKSKNFLEPNRTVKRAAGDF